jgi:hypothetical protein
MGWIDDLVEEKGRIAGRSAIEGATPGILGLVIRIALVLFVVVAALIVTWKVANAAPGVPVVTRTIPTVSPEP